MSDSVREPIQVYLSSAEREALERASRSLGVSRSEVLRRGLMCVESSGGGATGPGPVPPSITPATAGPGAPPPSLPVAPLGQILSELSDDRADR